MNKYKPSEIRNSALEMSGEEFKKVGKHLVEILSDFLDQLPQLKVSPGKGVEEIRSILKERSLPEDGKNAQVILEDVTRLLIENSTFNGHPRFWGYITSSATPIGGLGDLIASVINPNVGGWKLAPMATEIELQCIQWISEMVGYVPGPERGGILVSGGNMANFVGFIAARKAKATYNVREEGLSVSTSGMTAYCSAETHTWIQKAADLFGIGTKAIRWIETDDQLRMKTDKLVEAVNRDLEDGYSPFIVVGTAGSVSTGAIDPLDELAEICERYGLWFHIDGAYGGFVAALPEFSDRLSAFPKADSIALDPHKWLYSPIEAGCTLVKNKKSLTEAFSYTPSYYHFEQPLTVAPVNYYEYGLQNTRGFRALKVWLGLLHAGKKGYIEMIGKDIEFAAYLAEIITSNSELELFTRQLSITTFRYIPERFKENTSKYQEELNKINTSLLESIQDQGKIFLSNAVINGNFVLRACIVNFRTSKKDIESIPKIVLDNAKKIAG